MKEPSLGACLTSILTTKACASPDLCLPMSQVVGINEPFVTMITMLMAMRSPIGCV